MKKIKSDFSCGEWFDLKLISEKIRRSDDINHGYDTLWSIIYGPYHMVQGSHT